MLNTDEIIDSGFAALKSAQPIQGPADLAVKARRRAKAARMRSAAVGFLGCLSVAGVLVIAMHPTSALASLRESARLSAAQPVAHFHVVNYDASSDPVSRPAYFFPALDIWKFPDHYIRKQGHLICELFKSGRSLAYDDRIPFGFDCSYDVKNDHFWLFDGSIGVEINRRSGLAPTEKRVQAHGGTFDVYEWRFKNEVLTTAERIYVDPQSKLIRYAEGDRQHGNGDTNHGLVEVEYPSATSAGNRMPRFPRDTRFRTSKELVKAFYNAMVIPEQTKSIGGIRSSLYGVILHPDQEGGLRVETVTRGGAGPDVGSGHEPVVVGGPLVAAKVDGASLGAKHGRDQLIRGVRYLRNESLDLLARAPSRITVRVPVWRVGTTGGEHEFVGYVTYTTSRIFCCLNDQDVNWYDVASDRQ